MKGTPERENKRASDVLTFFHVVFIILAIASIVNIFIIQYFWEPDPKYVTYFQPKKKRQSIEPDRGAIIDCNGNLLAMSRRRITMMTIRKERRRRRNGWTRLTSLQEDFLRCLRNRAGTRSITETS